MVSPNQTLYQILDNYIKNYGELITEVDRLRYALVDLDEIIDFARHRLETNITKDQAKKISEVGLQWASYAQTHPDTAENFAMDAKEKLDGPTSTI